ncbi:MAG: hypothetical protein KAQ62_14815 [Cyclobacteriaceae bacterium]|nr:hypothetical protein [Cyclobacteriaceae bacterium]MCK5369830.1 hypothetical protein [Cyclobacteriaceae bacterium]MCK5468802.1 hypothetical protein [Cyclobacteriaceae bacterium]MCK5700039.1 hypothetical protein [Cyclobacteriaceae bacterium]
MNLETFKIDLAKQLFNINEKSVLEQIKMILDSKEIVAYATDGKPLNIQEYNAALENAEQDIRKGKVISSDELKNEIKSWRK